LDRKEEEEEEEEEEDNAREDTDDVNDDDRWWWWWFFGRRRRKEKGNLLPETKTTQTLMMRFSKSIRRNTPQWGGTIFCTIFFFEFYSLGYHVKEKRFSFSFFCLTFLLSPSFLDDTE
jgi:hypothetical protein